MGRGHRHDALRIPFEDLPSKPSGTGSPLREMNNRVVTLSAPCHGFMTETSTLCLPSALSILNPEAYSERKLFVEIGKLGTLATTAANASASSTIRLKFFNTFISLPYLRLHYFLLFPNFG